MKPTIPKLYAVTHPRCGETAVYLLKKPELGGTIMATEAILKNQDPPKSGDSMICDSCGMIIMNGELQYNKFRVVKDFRPNFKK